MANYSLNPDAACPKDKRLAVMLLRESLEQLPKRQRLLIHLRFWEHLTIAEIAILLRASWEEIDEQINEAYQTLKRMLLNRLEPTHTYRIA